MSSASKPATPGFGFLTVVDQPEIGLVGGYLVLNAGGRPLEFHCTAPVKPSRTQEILYGTALQSYLYGDQIGHALVSRAKTPALIVFTDQPAAMNVRESIAAPVVLVVDEAIDERTCLPIELGFFRAAIENRYSSDQPEVLAHWKAQGHGLDLAEPFGRIREALEETQKSARAA
jgi:hypothetical protein